MRKKGIRKKEEEEEQQHSFLNLIKCTVLLGEKALNISAASSR